MSYHDTLNELRSGCSAVCCRGDNGRTLRGEVDQMDGKTGTDQPGWFGCELGTWALRGLLLLLGFQALAAPPPPKTLAQLREDAWPVVEARCGKCHSKASPKVMPRALAVFDADQRDWSARLTKAQLSFALQRFGGVGASKVEMERVTALVEAEAATR